jgi:hypothetical protein
MAAKSMAVTVSSQEDFLGQIHAAARIADKAATPCGNSCLIPSEQLGEEFIDQFGSLGILQQEHQIFISNSRDFFNSDAAHSGFQIPREMGTIRGSSIRHEAMIGMPAKRVVREL